MGKRNSFHHTITAEKRKMLESMKTVFVWAVTYLQTFHFLQGLNIPAN
jgi:hypothetical protein